MVFVCEITPCSAFISPQKVSKDYYYITKNKKIDIPFMCYPPEYFKTQKYDKSCDVWSYGIMCWEMFAWGKVIQH